jgi:hypothetical protein
MDKTKGWKPRFTKSESVELCISCHSDSEKMKGFSLGTEQYKNFLESRHGKGFAKGDIVVPVCANCHSYHRVLGKDDIRSPSFAQNTSEVCKQCHSDREKMQKYNLPSTTIQDFKGSIHAKVLVEGHPERPGCIACHGSHISLGKAENSCTNCHQGLDKEFAKGACKGGQKGCMDCHRYHDTVKSSLEDYKRVCSKCHNVDTRGWKSAQEIMVFLGEADRLYEGIEDRIRWLEIQGIDSSGLEDEIISTRNRLFKKNPLLHSFLTRDALEILTASENATNKFKGDLQNYDNRLTVRNIKIYVFLGLIIIFVVIAGFLIKMQGNSGHE